VPVPYHQICRLRTGNSLKPLDPIVKIVRWHIRVRKTSPLVDGMHEMRAVVFAVSMLSRRQSRHDNRLSVVLVQTALTPMPGGPAARNFGRMGILVDRRRVLGGNATDCQPKNQNYDRGFPEIRHDPILMLILSTVMVTLVQGLTHNRAGNNLKIPARPKLRRKSRATVVDIPATPGLRNR